jgi:Uma2 family endonuclease
MAMPDAARRYTIEEVLEFPSDGNRYELVDGELLVTPAPSLRHQMIVGEVYLRLANYLSDNPGIARVLLSPADITFGGTGLTQPDIFVVPVEELGANWDAIRTLLLAIDVLSPSSARGDRVKKRPFYQKQGVATYWIIDPDAQMVEVWHPEDERPAIVTEELRWRIKPDGPDLVIPLGEILGSRV